MISTLSCLIFSFIHLVLSKNSVQFISLLLFYIYSFLQSCSTDKLTDRSMLHRTWYSSTDNTPSGTMVACLGMTCFMRRCRLASFEASCFNAEKLIADTSQNWYEKQVGEEYHDDDDAVKNRKRVGDWLLKLMKDNPL